MRGFGSKGIALIADSEFELRHHMLQRLLRRSGLEESEFFLGTVHDNLPQEIARRGIKVICPLGDQALRRLLGAEDILRWRGRAVELPNVPGVWAVPLLAPSALMNRRWDDDEENPAALRHPPRFHGVWIRDIRFAQHVAAFGFSRMPVNYLLDPPAGQFAQFADEYETALQDDPETMLSVDIETLYKQKNSEDEEDLDEKENDLTGAIIRCGWSFRPGHAVSTFWNSTYETTSRRLLKGGAALSASLKRKRQIVVWNGRTFDIPVLETAGYETAGTILDGMDLYHLYQSDLPKGLEWVTAEATDMLPWKHLASAQPAHYNATDADAALRNVLWLKERLNSVTTNARRA